MASYFLLTWNPRRGEEEWPDVDRCLSDSRDGRPVTLTWRCRNKSPLAGDRVFMLRQGVEPRGIMGSGDVLTAPYRSEPAAPRILQVRMDVVLDPTREGVLPISQLKQGELAEVHWNTQASGITIPDRAIPELLALWQAFLRRGHRSIAKWYLTEQYAGALRELESILNEPLREMLKAHMAAPGQCLSVNKLAAAAGYESPQIVYAQYGRLGKALGDLLKHDLHNETVFTRVFAHDHRAESGELYWTLDPAMTRALERQGLGDARNADGTERMGGLRMRP